MVLGGLVLASLAVGTGGLVGPTLSGVGGGVTAGTNTVNVVAGNGISTATNGANVTVAINSPLAVNLGGTGSTTGYTAGTGLSLSSDVFSLTSPVTIALGGTGNTIGSLYGLTNFNPTHLTNNNILVPAGAMYDNGNTNGYQIYNINCVVGYYVISTPNIAAGFDSGATDVNGITGNLPIPGTGNGVFNVVTPGAIQIFSVYNLNLGNPGPPWSITNVGTQVFGPFASNPYAGNATFPNPYIGSFVGPVYGPLDSSVINALPFQTLTQPLSEYASSPSTENILTVSNTPNGSTLSLRNRTATGNSHDNYIDINYQRWDGSEWVTVSASGISAYPLTGAASFYNDRYEEMLGLNYWFGTSGNWYGGVVGVNDLVGNVGDFVWFGGDHVTNDFFVWFCGSNHTAHFANIKCSTNVSTSTLTVTNNLTASNVVASTSVSAPVIAAATQVQAPTYINTGTSFSFPNSGQAFIIGTNIPTGVVSGVPGTFYLNFNGGAGNTLWIKESGNNNTSGWIAYNNYRAGSQAITSLSTSQAVTFSTPFQPGTSYSVSINPDSTLASSVGFSATSKTTNGFTITLSAGITGGVVVDYIAEPNQ